MTARWELPNGWLWAPAQAIAEIVGGGTPTASDESNFAEAGVPWITPADLSGYDSVTIARGRRDLSAKGYRESGAKLLPAGSVLFSSRAPIGYCVVAANELATNQGFKSLKFRCAEFVPEFYRYYLIGSKDYAESLSSGTTFKELSGARMAELLVPIAPINEQRRIVAKLEALQARSRRARDALAAVPPLLEKLRQSILAAAFRGELTKDWRAKNKNVEPATKLLERIRTERRNKWEESELAKMNTKGKAPADDKWKAKYEEPEPVDTTGLPDLPEGWCWAIASDLAEVVDPQPSHRTPPEYVAGVPYIGMGDVRRDGDLDLSNARKVSPDILREHRERYRLEPGDFIFGKIGTLGAPCRLPEPFDYALSANVVLVQPRSVSVHSAWMYFFMLSPQVDALLVEQSRATSQPAFGIKKLRDLPVPLPPLAEQEEASKRVQEALSRVSLVGGIEKEQRSRLAVLDRAVLAKAFRGELVQQDPDDEPADVMLARLRLQPATEDGAPVSAKRTMARKRKAG